MTATPSTGTAPKTLTVSVDVSQLPNGGHIAGTFTGQLLLEAPGSIATVPVTVTVGTAVFSQVNPISFVMPYGGPNPLPQVLSIPAADNSQIRFSASVATSNGGNWFSISRSGSGCCYTPLPDHGERQRRLARHRKLHWRNQHRRVGQSGQIHDRAGQFGSRGQHKAFFDYLPGQTSFSFTPSKHNPPSQAIVVGNGGGHTLNWTVSTTTADSGKWLKVLPAQGANAGTYTVSVTTKNLPGQGLIPGTYIGQQVLKAKTGNVTIPVSVTIGDPVFVQLPAVTFNTTTGVNPAPQVITIDSTSATIRFTPTAASRKGGTWLSISPSGNGCCYTPTGVTVSVNASTLGGRNLRWRDQRHQFANPGQVYDDPGGFKRLVGRRRTI